MSGKLLSLVLAGISGIAVFPAFVPTAAPSAGVTVPEATTVDSVHSSVMFRVKHMDTAYFYGTFEKMTGEVNLDEKAGSVSIEIDADSIDTNSEKRDLHLKGQDFFSVKEFPKIAFKSRTIAKKGGDWEVAGDFAMRGVTKPLTVVVKQTGASDDPRGGRKLGYEADFTIKRSDFGMAYGVDKKALADEVRVMISIEAAAKK